MKLLPLLLSFLPLATIAQTAHIDATGGLTSRLRYYGSVGLVYRAYNGIEAGATASHEIGHNTTASAYVGYATSAQSDYHSTGLVLFAGYGYTWHVPAAKEEIGGNRFYPVAGFKWMENYGIFEFKYVGNTFVASFGYRFGGHRD